MAKQSNGQVIALTVMTVAETPNLFSGMLPSLWTIGHFSGQDRGETTHWIRKGEAIASVMSLAIGLAVSNLAGSPLPFVGTVLMVGVLLAAYEHALRNPTSSEAMA